LLWDGLREKNLNEVMIVARVEKIMRIKYVLLLKRDCLIAVVLLNFVDSGRLLGNPSLLPFFSCLALLACLLALGGCDFQSAWSREYHLRQYEEWRTMGDRARVEDRFEDAGGYYQKAFVELNQAGAAPAQLARSVQDLAEIDLAANNPEAALDKFERAGRLFGAQALSECDELSRLRCLRGCGVALLKKSKREQAADMIGKAQAKEDALLKGVAGTASDDLACGWTPLLCRHSGSYWLISCRDPELKSAGTAEEFARIIEDPQVCEPVKRQVAGEYWRLLKARHDDRAAARVEAGFGLLHDLDRGGNALLQRRWEAAGKEGKALEESGKPDEARLAFEKAVQFAAGAAGDCPLRLLTSLSNLAFFHVNRGDLKSAIPLLQECVDLQKARFGADDRGLALPSSRLGSALLNSGQTDRAAPEIKAGFQLALKGYGRDSIFLARTECVLAALETAGQKFADAEEHIVHALSVLKRDRQRNEHSILLARLNLVEIYRVKGEAEKCLEQAAEAASFAAENGTYIEQMQTLKKLASICRDEGKIERTRETLARAREVIEEAAGSPKWKKWATRQMKILNQLEASQTPALRPLALRPGREAQRKEQL
jgi:tetratricopeptide (TPR) repeat protein